MNFIANSTPTMPFSNDVIPHEELPRYESAVMTPIHPDYWRVIQWRFLIWMALIVATSVLLFLIPATNPFKWYVITLLFALIALSYFLHKKAFARRGFAVRGHDIIYKRGILAVTTTIVPFNRIQHVSVKEGFISRKYRLATLQIFTAGGASSDLKIAGLPSEDAFKIKELVLINIKNKP